MISVLIVEDDLSLQKLYELMLKSFGFNIVAKANNGKDAIDQFKSLNKKPDVVLMDHRMPVKNGIDTTVEILKLNSKAKIIFASADKTVEKKALSIGAKAFIKKPFSIQKLIKEIEIVVN